MEAYDVVYFNKRRPATQVGNVVIFDDGLVRRLWWRERLLLWCARRIGAVVALPRRA